MSGQTPLDATDLRILAVLQREGRIANAELAERVQLSPSPCLRRESAPAPHWRNEAIFSW